MTRPEAFRLRPASFWSSLSLHGATASPVLLGDLKFGRNMDHRQNELKA